MARTPKGLQRLLRQLKALPSSVKTEMKEAIAEQAADMVVSIRYAAPVADGDLQRSVGWSWGPGPATSATGAFRGSSAWSTDPRYGEGLLATVYAGDDKAFYARWVEFGTSPGVAGQRVGARATDVKQNIGAGRVSLRTHPGTPAQPFFYPIIRARLKGVKLSLRKAGRDAAKRLTQVK